jgi:hypothetical protein
MVIKGWTAPVDSSRSALPSRSMASQPRSGILEIIVDRCRRASTIEDGPLSAARTLGFRPCVGILGEASGGKGTKSGSSDERTDHRLGLQSWLRGPD